MATGGFFVGGTELPGILRPCYSYLVSIPETPETSSRSNSDLLSSKHSSNFFSWGFTHDWCLTKGHYRCSGQDHFSALKEPKAEERCRLLTEWMTEKYPHLLENTDMSSLKYSSLYGVYSETPDSLPLVGRVSDSSRVCYVLGCNAWGQASLSYSSSLVPGILGYSKLTEEQQESLNLLSVRRYSMLSSVRNA